MSSPYQDAIREAFAICPTTKVIYNTLEIRQIGVQDSVFIVRSRRGIIATDENGLDHTYRPVGFDFALPPSTDEGVQSLTIAIDNINLEVTDFVKRAKTSQVKVEVIYRPYVSDDLTAPQMVPPLLLYLKDVQIGDFQVTGRCTFMDITNKKFPSELYTRRNFPALG